MAYKVISFFTDRKDNRHSYNVGDIFPRQGVTVSVERIKELLSGENRQKKPLIEKIEDVSEDISSHSKYYKKTDINRMSIAELKAFAKEQGIEAAEKMTGADLKKILIERLGL